MSACYKRCRGSTDVFNFIIPLINCMSTNLRNHKDWEITEDTSRLIMWYYCKKCGFIFGKEMCRSDSPVYYFIRKKCDEKAYEHQRKYHS